MNILVRQSGHHHFPSLRFFVSTLPGSSRFINLLGIELYLCVCVCVEWKLNWCSQSKLVGGNNIPCLWNSFSLLDSRAHNSWSGSAQDWLNQCETSNVEQIWLMLMRRPKKICSNKIRWIPNGVDIAKISSQMYLLVHLLSFSNQLFQWIQPGIILVPRSTGIFQIWAD